MKRKGTQFEQQSMFDASSYDKPEPAMDYDPEMWATRADITYHASSKPQMPGEQNVHPDTPPRQYGEPPRPSGTNFGYGFHHGDLGSALDRGGITSPSHISSEDFHHYNMRPFIHPLRQSGEMALLDGPNEPSLYTKLPAKGTSDDVRRSVKRRAAETAHPLVHTDSDANSAPGTKLVGQGKTVPYVNAAENPGSISFRSPRANLNTWAEDVASDPGASRQHRLLAEQFDLTIPAKENWVEGALSRGRARNLPTSLSGQVTEQPSLFGDQGVTQVSGQSELRVLQPKLKRKEQS